MYALGVLFFLFQFSFLEACLVVRSTECACPYMQLNPSNIDLVSNHPFYSYLTEYSIRVPLISGDNCSLSMYCDRDGYSLVVLDTDSNTNFNAYAADAFCEIETRTWMADFAGGMKQFKRLFGVCINLDPSAPWCAPSEQVTSFLAFSADIDKAAIQVYLEELDIFLHHQTREIPDLGFVRFDVKKEEPIQYFKDGVKFINTINSTITKTYSGLLEESDVLQVIERFLDNTEVAVCGSRITLLTTRPFPLSNTRDLVNRLRKNRIFLYIKTLHLGEANTKIMNEMVAKTYGYVNIIKNNDVTVGGSDGMYSLPFFNWGFCLYAVNVKLTGTGQITLPNLRIQVSWYHAVIVSGISRLDDGNNEFTISFSGRPNTQQLPDVSGNKTSLGSSLNCWREFRYLDPDVYGLKLNYSFANTQAIAIRFYVSERMINDWPALAFDWLPG